MNDSLLYIPLFIASISAFLTIIFLIIGRKRNKTTIVPGIISSVILCAGNVYAVINPVLSFYVIAVAVVAVMQLVASIIPLFGTKKTEEDFFEEELLEDVVETEESLVVEEDVVDNENKENLRNIVDAGREFMIHSAAVFPENGELNSLLEYINNTLMQQTNADGGVILLLDDFEDVLAVKMLAGDFPPPYKLPEDLPHKIVRVETNFRFSQFPLNETIFGAVARSGKAEFITDSLSDSRIYENAVNESEDFLKCGTYIFVPLKIRDTVIGVAGLARKATSEPFTEKDFDKAVLLGDLASTSIKIVYSYQEVVERSELTKESGIACKLQKSMHPKLLPSIPSLSLGCYYKTAEGVCGDYYDIIPARKDRISFVLGDVAGKGMHSLMIMVMLRAIIRLTVNTTQSAGTILSWANRGIITGENNLDHFASISLINYDSVNKTIQLATAGTTPVILYTAADDSIRVVSDEYEPVGVEKTTEYKDKEISVQSGDIIVTYTDGLVEMPDAKGMQYSQSRLMQIIKNNKHLTGKEIADVVKSDITKFSEASHQHDDQSLLIIKVQ